MKKTSQKGGTIAVLVGIIAILIAILSYMYFVQPKNTDDVITQTPTTNTPIATTTPTVPVVDTTPTKVLQNDKFSVAYSGTIFSAYEVDQTLPPAYDTKFKSIKLIETKRVGMMGKSECMYGQSGVTSTCNADSEAGIAFFSIESPISTLTNGLDASLKGEVTIAGKKSTSYKMGAEGSGIEYYYIPQDADTTILIIRKYREDGFPSTTLFSEVLNTLKVN